MQKSQSSKLAIEANHLGAKAGGQKPTHWASILQRTDSHAAVRPIWNLTPGELATAIVPAGHGQKEQMEGDMQGWDVGQRTGSRNKEVRKSRQ